MIHYLAAKLADSNNDNVVGLGAKNQKLYGVKTLYFIGKVPYGPNAGKFAYGTAKGETLTAEDATAPVETPTPAPTPTPTPTTPTPAAFDGVLAKGEAFLKTPAGLNVGFNKWGGIGTVENSGAPARFLSDAANGFRRLGIYDGDLDDITLHGRSIEGMGVYIDGVPSANMQLAGHTGIPGSFMTPSLWLGNVKGLEIEQSVRLDGKAIFFDVKRTNRSGKAMKVRSFRSIDPDTSERFETRNSIPAAGVIEADLSGGGKLVMSSTDAHVSFATNPYNLCHQIGTARPIGWSRTADDVLQMVWPEVTLQDDASDVISFGYAIVR